MIIEQGGDGGIGIRLDAGESLQTGDGDLSLSLPTAGGNLVTLGNGNDLLLGGAANDTISAGNGSDTVEFVLGSMTNTSLELGNGTDLIVLAVQSGMNDFLSFGDGKVTFTATSSLSDSSVSFGRGDDFLSFNNPSTIVVPTERNLRIAMGGGNDTMSSAAILLSTQVIFGDGNDSLSLFGILNSVADSNNVFAFGAGNDSVSVSANLIGGSFILGNGHDSLSFVNSNLTNLAVTVGDGSNFLQLSSTSVIGSGFRLGNGDNTIRLANMSGPVSIAAGDGNDQLVISDGSLDGSHISLGKGSETIKLIAAGGNFTIEAGGGPETIEAGRLAAGNMVFHRPLGAAPLIATFSGVNQANVSIDIVNSADAILSAPGGLTLNIAVDGFKTPNIGTAHYVATGEAIAAPYDIAQPLPYFIADLLFSPVPHWTATIGVQPSAPTFTFSIMQALPSYASSFDGTGFKALGPDLPASMIGRTPQQLLDANAAHTISLSAPELSVVTALAGWEAVANVDFRAAADSNSVQFRFGTNNQGLSSAAYSYVPPVPTQPDGSRAQQEAADVYFNNFNGGLDYAASGFGGLAAAHEIGHGLGFGGESGAADPGDVLPFGEDTLTYSVMTHHNGGINGGFPGTPQLFDVAVSQYLYGPNPTYHPNPSHLWTFSAVGGPANLVSDGGGVTNTISAVSEAQNALIDLRPGHWDYVGSRRPDIFAAKQLFIDYGTVVQVAIGGFGDDTLIGNDTNDSLYGGAGNDLLVVGPGNDTLDGGSGTNTALFADPRADYAVSFVDGATLVTELLPNRQGSDRLINIQTMQFSDDTISMPGPTLLVPFGPILGSGGDDTLIGTGAANTVFGLGGNDSIALGDGTALVVAGEVGLVPSTAENDTISAGKGDDTIWGGTGAGSITVDDGNDLIVVHRPGLALYGGTTVRLGSGTDTVYAVGGDNTVFGGAGLAFIDGGAGRASIVGGAGTTLMTGGAAASTLSAGSGATLITGLSGADSIIGGSGGDTILAAGGRGGGSGDTIMAGAGNDLITFGPGTETLFATLGGGKVTVQLGSFSAAGEQKSVSLGTGAATLMLGDSVAAGLGDGITIYGYKPGIDHFVLQGLTERSLSDMQIRPTFLGTNVVVADVATITLVGVASSKLTTHDFVFQ